MCHVLMIININNNNDDALLLKMLFWTNVKGTFLYEINLFSHLNMGSDEGVPTFLSFVCEVSL